MLQRREMSRILPYLQETYSLMGKLTPGYLCSSELWAYDLGDPALILGYKLLVPPHNVSIFIHELLGGCLWVNDSPLTSKSAGVKGQTVEGYDYYLNSVEENCARGVKLLFIFPNSFHFYFSFHRQASLFSFKELACNISILSYFQALEHVVPSVRHVFPLPNLLLLLFSSPSVFHLLWSFWLILAIITGRKHKSVTKPMYTLDCLYPHVYKAF